MRDTWLLWVDWVSGDAQTRLSFRMSVESLSPGSIQCVFLVVHGALRGLCSELFLSLSFFPHLETFPAVLCGGGGGDISTPQACPWDSVM